MRKLIPLGLVGAVVLSTSVALAAPSGFNQGSGFTQGPQGFDNGPATTIATIYAQGYEDQRVILEGRLTSYIKKDHYVFTDKAGDQIEVELDDDRNWDHLAKDQPIKIMGFVDVKKRGIVIEIPFKVLHHYTVFHL